MFYTRQRGDLAPPGDCSKSSQINCGKASAYLRFIATHLAVFTVREIRRRNTSQPGPDVAPDKLRGNGTGPRCLSISCKYPPALYTRISASSANHAVVRGSTPGMGGLADRPSWQPAQARKIGERV